MTVLSWSNFPNFAESEFRCKCGCGRADMDEGFMENLQHLRTLLGFPFVVSSGFRCPDHNAAVSTTGREGPHTTGTAADIRVHGRRAWLLVWRGGESGMTGIGVKQHGPREGRFIHLDMTEHPSRPTIWSYP